MRNYFNYFTEIEEYFVRRRGKNLLVSPLDWCLIELWKNTQIPLHVVLRGIDRSFQATGARRKGAPSTLFYCHPAVMEAFQEFRESRVGAPEEPAESPNEDLARGQVLRYLEELHTQLAGKPNEACQRGLELIESLRREFETHPQTSLEKVDRSLVQIGSKVAGSLQESLPAGRLKELRAETRKELRLYRKRLSEEAYETLAASYLERRVREEHGLPEFSLLQLLDSG